MQKHKRPHIVPVLRAATGKGTRMGVNNRLPSLLHGLIQHHTRAYRYMERFGKPASYKLTLPY